jgi:Secretion system C-terminal sorting domain
MKIIYLLLFFSTSNICNAQISFVTYLQSNLPEPITNTAIAVGKFNNAQHVYCFGGIDSSLLFSGIHQKCFAYNVSSQVWRSIPQLPDTLGKIAAAASTFKDTIYIVGGYHVFANGNEQSSNRVHRFVPAIESFIADATSIPIAIDDHVQATWRDSLIYVVTGWSNTGNVPNVQIFNPSTNAWQIGTATPNNNFYKAFGACGTIIEDTIFYFGGASMGTNFPAVSYLRKGVINPNNPTQITWSQTSLTPNLGYRSTCKQIGEYLCFIGGSGITYNYNGIAYNGSGAVPPLQQCLWYSLPTQTWSIQNNLAVNMDYRGIANLSDTSAIVLGGINASNNVSNKTILLNTKKAPLSFESILSLNIKIYPNPSANNLYIQTNASFDKAQLVDYTGKVVQTWMGDQHHIILEPTILNGNYLLQLMEKNNLKFAKQIIINH